MVRLREGQGRDVRRHRPEARALVRRRGGRQAASQAELHLPPAQPGAVSVQGYRAREAESAEASEIGGIRASAEEHADIRSGGLLGYLLPAPVPGWKFPARPYWLSSLQMNSSRSPTPDLGSGRSSR